MLFAYDQAFDRNVGWLTEWEQQSLRGKRVAIAGMGGVGGVHMLTLARFGIGAFSIADFDRFDIVNFNRQIGANIATIGRPKAEVLEEMALAINPELRIRRFDNGIDDGNIDAFLDGADVFIDGFDFFVLDIRRKVYQRCAELGIPALCAAPIGMGVGFLAFLPGKMTFEQYFRLAGAPETEQYLRFLVGLVPRGLHRAYLVDRSRLDLVAKRGPSTGASCQLCASVASVNAVRLMLGRGGVRAAPHHHHYDPYVGRLVTTTLRWGNNGPLQRLKLLLGGRAIGKALARAKPAPPRQPSPGSPLEAILDLARWAPSGDNSQPWRFEIAGEDRVIVHLAHRDRENVYEYRDWEPTVLAGGILLESLRVAASAWGRRIEWRLLDEATGLIRIAVDFITVEGLEPDPLAGHLLLRSVNRGAYRRRPLKPAEKAALAAAAGDALSIDWYEGRTALWRMTRLSAKATDIRLRAPEAYAVHKRVIDWDRPFSPDGLPSGAIGLGRGVLPVMRWAMATWERLDRVNRWTGTWLAQWQLDYTVGPASAAWFALRLPEGPPAPEQRVATLLRAGQHLQRFWLTAAKLGLAMQPALAIIIFADYAERDKQFTSDPKLLQDAKKLAADVREVFGREIADHVFLGRIGEPFPRLPLSRSTRIAWSRLVLSPKQPPIHASETPVRVSESQERFALGETNR
jgi:molybdopterin/thiamine biosynthesis adenylyltransferase/nitroreductase